MFVVGPFSLTFSHTMETDWYPWDSAPQTCQWEDCAYGFPVPRTEQPRLNTVGECLVNAYAVREGVKRGTAFQELQSHCHETSPFVSKCSAGVGCGCSLWPSLPLLGSPAYPQV